MINFVNCVTCGLALSPESPKQDPAQGPYYDEVRQPNGLARAHYAPALNLLSLLSPVRRQAMETASKPFLGGVTLDRRPRVLPTNESELLTRGVQQRAQALRLFLQDYYSGRQTFRSLPTTWAISMSWGIVTSPIPITRGISVDANCKVNVSGSGRLFATFVETWFER